MHLDGFRNLWIVKPGAKSRGRGIQVMYKLEDIIQKITATNTNDPRFVVQKYIGKKSLQHWSVKLYQVDWLCGSKKG
jgi:Biotin carboxylase